MANLVVRAHVDGEDLLEEEFAESVEAEKGVAVHVVEPTALERRAAGTRDAERSQRAARARARDRRERASRLGDVAAVEQKQLVEPELHRVARRVPNALVEPQLVEQTTPASRRRHLPGSGSGSGSRHVCLGPAIFGDAGQPGLFLTSGRANVIRLLSELLHELQAQRSSSTLVTALICNCNLLVHHSKCSVKCTVLINLMDCNFALGFRCTINK